MLNYSQEKFSNLINDGIISFYGYSFTNLPITVIKSKYRKINIFFKKNHKKKLKNIKSYNSYFGYKGISYGEGEIVLLDQDAVKALCIGYPTTAKLVLISLRDFKFYIYIFIGLLRRIINQSIKIKGFIWLTINSKEIPWIIIENPPIKRNAFTFSSNLGVKGLLNYLLKEEINYFVPRFYSSLPNLNKKSDDLDLVVDKKDVDKLIQFLNANPGKIAVDVYTDTGLDFHGISYFPPYLAKEILKRSVEGPANSKVPNKYDTFLLLIYHVLYHKGFLSGLPSRLIKNKYSLNDNKYFLEINQLKRDLKINIGNTLEELDNFMFDKGWRPAADTLTKISEWNEWVNLYHNKENKSKTPLYVLMIKKKCVATYKEELLIKECEKQKLKIIEKRILVGSLRDNAIREIRGGIWSDSLNAKMNQADYFPEKIFVIWDLIQSRVGGFSYVKEILRKKIDDNNGPSLIHSSDNYSESLDYIKVCIPDKFNYYKDEIHINKIFSRYNENNIKLSQFILKINKYFNSILIKIFGH